MAALSVTVCSRPGAAPLEAGALSLKSFQMIETITNDYLR
jgi:hypothetical protein